MARALVQVEDDEHLVGRTLDDLRDAAAAGECRVPGEAPIFAIDLSAHRKTCFQVSPRIFMRSVVLYIKRHKFGNAFYCKVSTYFIFVRVIVCGFKV